MTGYSFTPATSSPFVRDFVRWRELSSDAALEYGETLAMVTLAALAGGRLRIPIRQIPWPIACNLYALILGPSTISRKSNSLQATEDLIRSVMPSALMAQPGSPEGLVEDLARHETQGAVLVMDELSWWFSAMKNRAHLKDMPGYLMRAYDGASIAHRNKSKMVKGERVEDEVMVRRPVLTIAAGATPERLAMVSTKGDTEDGWWPRWIVCWPSSRPPLQPLSAPDGDVTAQSGLTERLRAMNERLGTGKAALLTPDAWRVAQERVGQIEEMILSDPENSAIYSRADLRVFKVAALLALANDAVNDGPIMVQENDVEEASILCMRWLEDARRLMDKLGQDEFENNLNRALVYAQTRGPVLARRVVTNAIRVRAKLFQEIEESLIERALIERFEVKNVAYWRVIEPDETLLKTKVSDLLSRMEG